MNCGSGAPHATEPFGIPSTSRSPVLTGFAIAHSDILSKAILPEAIIEVGPILNVKYATPLSDELSENFDKVIKKSNGFLMENHRAPV